MQLGEPRQTGSPQAGSLRRHSRAIVLRIVAAQIAVGLLIALALFVLQGQFQGYSALVGALIAALPNYYLVVRMFQRRGSDSAEDLLRNVYVAEMVKIVFTVSLFLSIIAISK